MKKETKLKVVVVNPLTEEQKENIYKRLEDYFSNQIGDELNENSK